MIKRILQNIAPEFLLSYYKKKAYIHQIKNADISDEPDLIIAQKIISADSVVIDIGSNIGLYVHFLSQQAKKIISFEPVPFTFDILLNNASKFGWNNLEAHQIAISDKVGETSIKVPIQSGVYNYFRATVSEQENGKGTSYMVHTKTIDSLFMKFNEPISLIKCDTEGHELAALKGAQQFLKTKRPAWLMEVSGNPDKLHSKAYNVFKFLSKLDYTPYFFEEPVLKKRKKGDTSINYFFLQKSHVRDLENSGVAIE